MKKTLSILTLTLFASVIIMSSCQSSANKIEKAEVKVLEANKVLEEARQDSIAEYQKFRKEYEEKIAAHEKIITDFKARIANEKLVNKAIYEKKLLELEQKNSDMKKTLEKYIQDGQNNWQFFKTEFSSDMNKLGDAFNDFVKNTK